MIAAYAPDEAAVEETFVARNARLGAAARPGARRGAAGARPRRHGGPRIRRQHGQEVGGRRRPRRQGADRMMVRMLLPGAACETEDAADALAVAICHAHHAARRSARLARGREPSRDRPAHRPRRFGRRGRRGHRRGRRRLPGLLLGAHAAPPAAARRGGGGRGRDPCARGPHPSLRLRRRDRARLVPPADDRAGGRRARSPSPSCR